MQIKFLQKKHLEEYLIHSKCSINLTYQYNFKSQILFMIKILMENLLLWYKILLITASHKLLLCLSDYQVTGCPLKNY